ncbi:MAG: hypothetical protein HDS72_05150 [Bacteroidales bacterium]|nr:hypothetical protein [Bacteroidales bacterium]
MFWIVQLSSLLGICVALPVLIVWLICRTTINRDNKNAEIVIKALENNSAVDTDKLVAALGKKQKSPAELLNVRLLRGCIFTFSGIALAIMAGIMVYSYHGVDSNAMMFIIPAGIALAIGIAYLTVYFKTRKGVKSDD